MRPIVVVTLPLILGLVSAFGADEAFSVLADRYESEVLLLVEQHCVGCHDTETQKGDLDLERFTDLASIRAAPEVWQRVLEQVTSGEMPPKDEEPMVPTQKVVLLDWVKEYLRAEAPLGYQRMSVHRKWLLARVPRE